MSSCLCVVVFLQHHPIPQELLERPVPIRTGIGAAHDTVSTSFSEAQAFYDQGLAYLHSYVWIEAARSFNQALRIDPKLAMAHAGLSIAYTELNLPDSARSALQQARSLANGGHDRRHIEIRTTQIAGKLPEYRKALDDALKKFPSDEELWLQRGMAESTDPADRGQASGAKSVPFYERALAIAPDHFAAHHYLIHALENSGRIDEALKHGAVYARMAPDVPHARHMYAHDLRRVGRIDEAVAEFETADRLEIDYFRNENVAPQYDWHYQHNLDLLATSYQYLGQMKKAERSFRASFEVPSPFVVQEFNKREWPMFLLARGRVDEALAAGRRMAAHSSPLIRATGHIEIGHALLAKHQFKEAADEANEALRELKNASDGGAMVAPALQHLQGEFFLRTGQREKGRSMLDEVIKKARRTTGPDEWTQALFTIEAIARSAREVGDWEYAGRVAAQMLEHDAAYAGAHYALGLAAEHAGDRNTALSEFGLAKKYWVDADPELPEIVYVDGKRNR